MGQGRGPIFSLSLCTINGSSGNRCTADWSNILKSGSQKMHRDKAAQRIGYTYFKYLFHIQCSTFYSTFKYLSIFNVLINNQLFIQCSTFYFTFNFLEPSFSRCSGNDPALLPRKQDSGLARILLLALTNQITARRFLSGINRGRGEHSATPGTFFVFGSSNKK